VKSSKYFGYSKQTNSIFMFLHLVHDMYVLRKKGKNVPVSSVKAIREIKF